MLQTIFRLCQLELKDGLVIQSLAYLKVLATVYTRVRKLTLYLMVSRYKMEIYK